MGHWIGILKCLLRFTTSLGYCTCCFWKASNLFIDINNMKLQGRGVAKANYCAYVANSESLEFKSIKYSLILLSDLRRVFFFCWNWTTKGKLLLSNLSVNPLSCFTELLKSWLLSEGCNHNYCWGLWIFSFSESSLFSMLSLFLSGKSQLSDLCNCFINNLFFIFYKFQL